MKNSKRRKIRGLEEWKIGKGNGERQGRDIRQKLSGMTEEQIRHRIATGAKPLFTKPATWVRNDDTSVPGGGCLAEPVEASRRNVSRNAAFTLVELVIVIAIVIVLSVVSVPIYRSYVDKAKWTEGYAFLGTILSAEKAYYSEYGIFSIYNNGSSSIKGSYYDAVLGIDVKGNKYFTTMFYLYDSGTPSPNTAFWAQIEIPKDIRIQNGKTLLSLYYNITSGATVGVKNWGGSF